MTLAPLTTFSPLRIRSAETPPKLERPLTPGREMTREERKVARRRDGGGLDTAYVAKRMTFKLPSFINHSHPPIKLPVSCDIPNPSLASLQQAGPSLVSLPVSTASSSKPQPNTKSSLSSSQSQSRATSENPKSQSLTKNSKGRLSNEALAKGWGIESSHRRTSSHGTRQLTRPSLEADTSCSRKKRGLPEATCDDDPASSVAPLVPVKVGSDTADKSIKKANKLKKAQPARPKSRTEKSQSTQSSGTDIISSRKDPKSRAVDDDSVSSKGLKATSANEPHSSTSNLSTSSETPNKRDINEFSKDSSVPLKDNVKKQKVNRPLHDDSPLSDANHSLASSSTDHSQSKPRKDESRTNKIHSELEPAGITNGKSHNPSSSTSRSTTITKKEKRPESIKISKSPKRGVETTQTNMPWKPVDPLASPITPAYAKAFPSLTSTLQRPITSTADPIVNRRLSTQLSDITNTIHSARPSATLTTTTQISKNPKTEVVRPIKTTKKGKARLDPMIESLERDETSKHSERVRRPEEQQKQTSSSDGTKRAEGTSTKPQPSIDADVSKDVREENIESKDSVDSEVSTHERHAEKSRSSTVDAGPTGGSSTKKRSMDPSPKWSALDTDLPQPKKIKKLAHKVFTPAKSSGGLDHTTRDQVDEVAPIIPSNPVKNTCNEDELYLVTDRFVDEEDDESLEFNRSNQTLRLLSKIKHQLNPPDIVWISIRKLLQDEIDNLPRRRRNEDGGGGEIESVEKGWLEEVYDRFKRQMMEYSDQIIKHGILKLRLQRLIEQEKREKKVNDSGEAEAREKVRRSDLISTSTSKNKGLEGNAAARDGQVFKKEKKIDGRSELDDGLCKQNKNSSTGSSKLNKARKPNKNKGKSTSKPKVK